MHATMIGLDIAKTVFQVYGEDSEARAVLRKRLSRTALVRDNVAAGGSPGRLANGDRIVSVLRCAPGTGCRSRHSRAAHPGSLHRIGCS